MKYAVVKISGSQYLVSEGDQIKVNKLPQMEGEKVAFKNVMLKVDDGEVVIGRPNIEKAQVTATVVKQLKGDKIRVAKFKAKTGYRRVTGFRSRLTSLKIEKI